MTAQRKLNWDELQSLRVSGVNMVHAVQSKIAENIPYLETRSPTSWQRGLEQSGLTRAQANLVLHIADGLFSDRISQNQAESMLASSGHFTPRQAAVMVDALTNIAAQQERQLLAE